MAYEFSKQDGTLIKSVGFRLTTQGVVLIIAGLAGIIYAAVNFSSAEDTVSILIYTIQSAVEIFIGIGLLLSPRFFKKVAETQGKDIQELMEGLGNLNTAFIIVWTTLTLNLLLDVILIILSGA